MASLSHVFLGILILQIYAHAAPSDGSKLEDIAKVETAEEPVDTTPKDVESDAEPTETQRQKRFYNPYAFGGPPISKLIYPNSFNRDVYDNFGGYGVEDPLAQIHRRVQEIASYVRQPPPPPIPHIPIFYPVLFIPPFDCACNPTEPSPSDPTIPDNSTASPNVTNRFPEMEDDRQNWGLVTNDNNDDGGGDDEGQDFSRPISFDPIKFNRPNARPPPPVEHGTVQSDSGNSDNPPPGVGSSSSAAGPPPPSTRRPQPPAPPPPVTQNPFFTRPPPRRPPPVGFSPNGPPTACDGAILVCCHQPQVVFDCFALQGCSSFTPYGNPCETNAILRVVEKYQRFYDSRNG